MSAPQLHQTEFYTSHEALLPDVARSFAFALFVVLLFGGQVALVMAVSTGITLPMLLLLLAVVMTAG